jgi:hypothetical protein
MAASAIALATAELPYCVARSPLRRRPTASRAGTKATKTTKITI